MLRSNFCWQGRWEQLPDPEFRCGVESSWLLLEFLGCVGGLVDLGHFRRLPVDRDALNLFLLPGTIVHIVRQL